MSETPLPSFVDWDSFPFEGRLRLKKLDDPVEVEPPRVGEDPADCPKCKAPDDAYIWVNENWRVRSMDRPSGLPMVLILESRSHLDLGDLPNMLAAELGVMTVRLERAIRSLDGVARVHVNRWGDGAAHLHVWFMARPYGRLQLRGTFLTLWDEILPPIPEAKWRENLAMVAAWLAEFGGEPLAKPPRIAWKAPSSLPAEEELAATLAAVGVADADRRQGEPEAEVDNRETATAAQDGPQPGRAEASRDEGTLHHGEAPDGQATGGGNADADTEKPVTEKADAGKPVTEKADAEKADAEKAETDKAGSVPAQEAAAATAASTDATTGSATGTA